MLSEQAAEHLDEHGYVILENVLTVAEVAFIREIVVKLAEWERKDGGASLYGEGGKHQRIWNLLNKHEVFRETIQKPAVLAAMAHLFGDHYLLSSWTVNIIGGKGGDGALHIDAPVPEPVPAYPVKANSIWLLDDFTEYNGATICLPGSHRFTHLPKPEDEHREGLIKLLAPKGSVVITHGQLWHKSGLNVTNEDRIVLLGSFCPTFMRIQEDYLRVLEPEIIEQSSPLLKQLIGVGYGIHEGALIKPPQL